VGEARLLTHPQIGMGEPIEFLTLLSCPFRSPRRVARTWRCIRAAFEGVQFLSCWAARGAGRQCGWDPHADLRLAL